MRTVATGETRRASAPGSGPRQTKVVLKHIQPWSVFKFSLLFSFCLMLAFLFAFVILYWALSILGVLESLSRFMVVVGLGSTKTGFEFDGFWIFSRVFLMGMVGVVVWSLVNLFVALLYNLVADIVGGIQVTLGERR